MWTENFQMFQLDLEKAEEPEIKLPTSFGSQKKQENSRKTSTSGLPLWLSWYENVYFCFTDYTKAFVWITAKWGMFFKIWKYQSTIPASCETRMQDKKQQLEPDMEQCTGSKLERSTSRLLWYTRCISSPCLFNLYAEYIMQNARLDEAQAGIKISRRNINNLR